MYNPKTESFVFQPGPVMANVLLADEINRTIPRTQSSLLESMAERQVTVDGETVLLPRPFFVIATQNPIELEGTFPLPEAQLDRFLLKLEIGYPNQTEEIAILKRFQRHDPFKRSDIRGNARTDRGISRRHGSTSGYPPRFGRVYCRDHGRHA